MSRRFAIAARVVLFVAFVACAVVAPAQRAAPAAPEGSDAADAIRDAIQSVFERVRVPPSRYVNSRVNRAMFRPVIESTREAVVEVRSPEGRLALGGVVGPDGWVLTGLFRQTQCGRGANAGQFVPGNCP